MEDEDMVELNKGTLDDGKGRKSKAKLGDRKKTGDKTTAVADDDCDKLSESDDDAEFDD
jgi:hypothetical protein